MLLGLLLASCAPAAALLGSRPLHTLARARHSAHASPARSRTALAANAATGSVVYEQRAGVKVSGEAKSLLRAAERVVPRVAALEAELEALDDAALRSKVAELRAKFEALPLSSEPSEADAALVFALAREAAWRVLRLRAYDVQVLGGLVMSTGALAEMATGEGKTLAAIAPTLLAALRGKGALVVTANDYLARRDADSVGQVHRFLGLSVGLVESTLATGSDERRDAYASDVTYVSNAELGFDYLRDQLALAPEELVLPERSVESMGAALFYWCLVDEADSILVDEARTPLIISEQTAAPAAKYELARELVVGVLREGEHYEVDLKGSAITLTEEGYAEAQVTLGTTLFDPKDPWAPFIVNALRAHKLLAKDKDYILDAEAGIKIVDAFSGRVLEGRRWTDGLQQSVEVKEGLPPSSQTRPSATVTFQALFRGIATKLAGMTGTANTDALEFLSVYGLTVVPVPTALPIARKDYDDAVYRTVEAKLRATAAEVARAHKSGRPVLVGTTSVQDSDAFVERLASVYGVTASVLNARPENAATEGATVAQAGRVGAVTVATNMAGRGTDIVLGGNAKDLAKLQLEAALLDAVTVTVTGAMTLAVSAATRELVASAAAAVRGELFQGETVTADDAEQVVALVAEKAALPRASLRQLREACTALRAELAEQLDAERAKVLDLGGLYVVGTQRHESRRIDDQLRGRSGRQGDPGASRFFVSVDDTLFRTFGADSIGSLMRTFRVGEDLPLEAKSVTEALTKVQVKVETYNAELRQRVLQFEDVLDMQRRLLYATRRRVLVSDDADASLLAKEWTLRSAEAVLGSVRRDAAKDDCAADFDAAGEVRARLAQFFTAELALDADACLAEDPAQRAALDAALARLLDATLAQVALARPARSAPRSFATLALVQTDKLWADHLTSMNALKEAVQLRSFSRLDPFDEYQREGRDLFDALLNKLKTDTVYSFFKLAETPP